MTKKIVAVTACPTGVAHTFMAAEALEIEARKRGDWIKVETRGSVGAKEHADRGRDSAGGCGDYRGGY